MTQILLVTYKLYGWYTAAPEVITVDAETPEEAKAKIKASCPRQHKIEKLIVI